MLYGALELIHLLDGGLLAFEALEMKKFAVLHAVYLLPQHLILSVQLPDLLQECLVLAFDLYLIALEASETLGGLLEQQLARLLLIAEDAREVFTPDRLLKGVSEGALRRRSEGLSVLVHGLGAEFQELFVLRL
jgi:hypothetical protein